MTTDKLTLDAFWEDQALFRMEWAILALLDGRIDRDFARRVLEVEWCFVAKDRIGLIPKRAVRILGDADRLHILPPVMVAFISAEMNRAVDGLATAMAISARLNGEMFAALESLNRAMVDLCRAGALPRRCAPAWLRTGRFIQRPLLWQIRAVARARRWRGERAWSPVTLWIWFRLFQSLQPALLEVPDVA